MHGEHRSEPSQPVVWFSSDGSDLPLKPPHYLNQEPLSYRIFGADLKSYHLTMVSGGSIIEMKTWNIDRFCLDLGNLQITDLAQKIDTITARNNPFGTTALGRIELTI